MGLHGRWLGRGGPTGALPASAPGAAAAAAAPFFFEMTNLNPKLADYIFIVTHYGCNSGAHCMWPPKSKAFTTYASAYAYFLTVAPSLSDPDNRAEQDVNAKYQEELGTKEYVRIEHRVQIGGYLDGDGTCAKRPQGAVLAAARL